MSRFEALRKAFPSYDLKTLPPIPQSWEDVSYVNDVCPSFMVGAGIHIFVDFADPSDREIEEADRFSVSVNTYTNMEFVLQSDDWTDVLITVAELLEAEELFADNNSVARSDLKRAHREYGLDLVYDRTGKTLPLKADLFTKPITCISDALKFIRHLIVTDKMFHFEDSPESILHIATGKPFFDKSQCGYLDQRVGEMYALDWSKFGTECPIGGYFLLEPLEHHYEEQALEG